ncbi:MULTISPECIES: hypothetical protein [Pseudoalteromonas]|uniref:Hemolysin D n=1 Tax=Pseudoalteromonas luteoviolacea (strain 2ta16) TaxID=1353533 RepID=V4HAP3_PSEL2|nr:MULTISPECIES: hypothetical protein [Pseudoalteromonas]ESP94541.1 hypothetical protein PL2TA16_00541 [Pseudoalteromonas luteoviolacea 2ta16]KZN32235.1 hypothetical protein N483_03555 [Pseudoalteromonas luteoviolacea NCIMB 1944]MCG7548034.1 hemolysin D [Pseudoalteromonas sp. Of7M-16]
MKLKYLSCVVAAVVTSSSAMAFTQLGGAGVMPIGHEWLTRTAALELMGQDTRVSDPQDPRLTWQNGLAKSTELNVAQHEVERILSKANEDGTYWSEYDAVFAAIVGERWVDIAGFNVTSASTDPTGPNCFNAVAQEPADLQQDHFMRRYDDIGGIGGVNAAKRAQQRFISHFVNAAIAESKKIKVWDGGGYAKAVEVDHNYFLFGRAVHLFQDSFSPEHTVRLAADNYEKIWQVKAYLCSEGAEQHTHDTKEAINFQSGDVIWKPESRGQSGWQAYKPSNIKPVALVSLEASKDLWAAFIRTMALPVEERKLKAEQEARQLVANWLSFDEQAMLSWYNDEEKRDHTYVLAPGERGKGKSLLQCMAELNVGTTDQLERVAQLEEERRHCLYNIEAETGYSDVSDPLINMPYNWKWKSLTWKTPPEQWQPQQLDADTGEAVHIHNVATGKALGAQSGEEKNALLNANGVKAVEFLLINGGGEEVYFRTRNNAELFLSYKNNFTGDAMLWTTPDKASFNIESYGTNFNLKNSYWQQYVWADVSTGQVHLSRKGEAHNKNAQWQMIKP